MQTRHVLGLSFALLVACGGRTGLDLDDELRGERGGSVTALGGAGLGTAATGAGGMGGAHAGGGAMTITGSSGAAPAVNAGVLYFSPLPTNDDAALFGLSSSGVA